MRNSRSCIGRNFTAFGYSSLFYQVEQITVPRMAPDYHVSGARSQHDRRQARGGRRRRWAPPCAPACSAGSLPHSRTRTARSGSRWCIAGRLLHYTRVHTAGWLASWRGGALLAGTPLALAVARAAGCSIDRRIYICGALCSAAACMARRGWAC
jgi:hypothetical protein